MTPTERADKLKLLEKTLNGLGVDSSNFQTGDSIVPADFIPTGQPEVDAILGEGGGIPRGTLVEFCGKAASGKTYLGIKTMAQAQEMGEMVCFVDIENTFYVPRAEAIGLKVNDPTFRYLSNLGAAEDYANAIVELVDSKLFSVIFVDSIGTMEPKDAYEKNFNDADKIGAHAKFVKKFTKRLLPKCARTNTIVILANHLYVSQGALPGTFQDSASGGNAIGYNTHMRIWINKIDGNSGQILNSDGNIIGGYSRVFLKKTRYSQPNLSAQMPIMYQDVEPDLIEGFIFRAKNKEYIEELRKKLIYVNKDTGEKIETKDRLDFVKQLLGCSAPLVRTKGDNSTNALEYICGRVKIQDKNYAALLSAINKSKENIDE